MITTSILVPLTMDPETERAVPHAVRLAQLTNVPIVLFTWSFDDGEAALEYIRLQEIAKTLPVPTTVDAKCSEEMCPAPAIVRAAAAHNAHIVMASHGRTGVGEAVFGSIAEEVLRARHAPIILVGPYATDAGKGPVGTVVACVDGSDLAESALPVAVGLAARIGGELQLVEVVDPMLVGTIASTHGDVSESGYLARTISAIPGALRPTFEVLHGPPAKAIVSYAGANGAELVAVATHGRTGVSRAALGSVAMGVVRHATCPVLVTPPAR